MKKYLRKYWPKINAAVLLLFLVDGIQLLIRLVVAKAFHNFPAETSSSSAGRL